MDRTNRRERWQGRELGWTPRENRGYEESDYRDPTREESFGGESRVGEGYSRGYSTGSEPRPAHGEHGRGRPIGRTDYEDRGRYAGQGYGVGYGQGASSFGGWQEGSEYLSSEPYPWEPRRSYGYGPGGYDFATSSTPRAYRGRRQEWQAEGDWTGGYGQQAMEPRAYGFAYPSSSIGEGRGRYSGRGPQGYRRSDDRIREDVCDRLTEHGDIDATGITVTVSNGEVTLSGSVDDRHMKYLAENLAESVAGVRDVNNQIRVNRGSTTTTTSDTERKQGQTETSRSRTTASSGA